MRKPLFILILMLLTGAAGCSRSEEQKAQPEPQAMLVTVAPVLRTSMKSEVTLLGVTVALKTISVRSPASGFLSALTLQPGDPVRRGQIVARLVTREDEAARAGMRMADKLDPADRTAMLDAVHRYASSPGIPVTAGESGVVNKRLISSGQFVNEFDPILELIDPHSTYVEAQVPLNVLPLLRIGMRATIMFPGIEKGVAAHIAALLPGASQGNQTFPVRIAFDSSPPIGEAGVAVQVSVLTALRPDTISIPDTALFVNPETQASYVFVLGPDGRAQRRTVKMGIRDRSRAEVIQGLNPGETVITSGGYALSNGIPVHAAAK